jgi:DNA-damage-inducible protein J
MNMVAQRRTSTASASPPFSVRLDPNVRRRAEVALDAMGLSLGGYLNMAVAAAARGDVNPMDFMSPGPKTLAAIKELQEGGGKSFVSVDELMADLNADD